MEAMYSFQPTEAPSWDATVPTSEKMKQICDWTEQFQGLPSVAKDFVREGYCRAAVARFVLSSNLSEETGLNDLESTQEVLEAAGSISGKPAKETKQLGDALQFLGAHYMDLSAHKLQHRLEALSLTPDIIHEVHRILMHGLIGHAGKCRTGEAYGGFATGVFFYQPPALIPSLLLTMCDFYNQALSTITNSTDQVSALYHLAAALFVQFVTVHPFSDGNGRVARLLASHVLRSVTPFPVTPYADGTALTRTVYVGAIMASRLAGSASSNFLSLSPPADFAALLIHAGWECWENCFDNIKRLGLTSAQLKRGVLNAQTYGWTAYQQLVDLGLSPGEKEEEHETISRHAIEMQQSGRKRSEVCLKKDSVCVLYNSIEVNEVEDVKQATTSMRSLRLQGD